MLAVLGVLKTAEGLRIKAEMLSWLEKEYDVFCCEQDPPGRLYEFPAISCALHLAVRMDEPVLYIHTKGAGNAVPLNYKDYMMHPTVRYPTEATPEDCQRVVRLMWQTEFTGSRLQKYIDVLQTNEPRVACPFSGKEKITWQNAWIINTSGAKELLKTFHLSSDRYYYEWLFNKSIIKVIPLVLGNCNAYDEPHHKTMWDKIWTYYK